MTTDVPLDPDLVTERDGPTDAALVDAVGTGDVDAFLELWHRHRQSAYVFARRWSATDGPTESAVNRAFSEVLLEIAAGRAVDGPFRLHLYRRLFAEDLWESPRPLPLVVRAFGALSAPARSVLWYLVVEDESREAVALMVGVPATDLHALLRVAQVELRTRWLTEIVESPTTPPDCAWVAPRLDLRASGALAPSSNARYDRHLEQCARCREVLSDLADVGGLLRRAAHTLVAPRDPDLQHDLPHDPQLDLPSDLDGPSGPHGTEPT